MSAFTSSILITLQLSTHVKQLGHQSFQPRPSTWLPVRTCHISAMMVLRRFEKTLMLSQLPLTARPARRRD